MTVKQVDIIIPSSEEDRQKLKASVQAMSDSLTRKKAEMDYFNESAKDLSEKYDIPVKFIKRMATDMNKGDFENKVSEEDQYHTLYETIANITK